MMAIVDSSVMPEEPITIPWPQIIDAVLTLMKDTEQLVKAVKGEGWSVYRTGKLIRIDIQQGE
jgi:hypothetical protein